MTGRAVAIWGALICIIGVAIAAAALSPLLAWREPIYILAGLAGIVGLALMLFQPLLAGGYLPGISLGSARRIHRYIGAILVVSVLLHVVALWITSPPDVADVLLFRSPAPFSIWGAVAMWAIFFAGLLAVFRRRVALQVWRKCHSVLVIVAVVGTVIHALLIEGTMEMVSKTILCAAVALALVKVLNDRGFWTIVGLQRR